MAKIKTQKLKKKEKQQAKTQENDEVMLPATRSSDDPIPNKVSTTLSQFHPKCESKQKKNIFFLLFFFPEKLGKQTTCFSICCPWYKSS